MKEKAGYKNEVEKPAKAKQGSMMSGMGLGDFKGEGSDQIYGQAGNAGCKADTKKIMSQFKNYSWGSETGNSGY
jgi:hypothetical protein